MLIVLAHIQFIFRIIIDREAREIMYLVASVRLSVRVFVCLSELSCLNRLTYEKNREESLSVRGVCLCVDYLARMRSIGVLILF